MPPIEPRHQIPDELLKRFENVTSATCFSAVFRMGIKQDDNPDKIASWQNCYMYGVRPMTPGRKFAARARTLRFIPPRPDLLETIRKGEFSAEYEAMGSCGPGDILVVDGMRNVQYCILGNVKTRHLWMREAVGVVTDAAIRDLDQIRELYGLVVFAGDRSPVGNRPGIEAYEANVPIGCGGVLVLPGDLIVGDDDGVVVIPCQLAEEVIDWIEEHERVEHFIMGLMDAEKAPPGCGQLQPIAVAAEQLGVQLLLQIPNLPADCRMRQAQLIGGAAYVAQSSHHFKGTERIEG